MKKARLLQAAAPLDTTTNLKPNSFRRQLRFLFYDNAAQVYQKKTKGSIKCNLSFVLFDVIKNHYAPPKAVYFSSLRIRNEPAAHHSRNRAQ